MTGYVALGSNLDDRLGLLETGLTEMVASGLEIEAVSSVWETEPVDMTDAGRFLNAAARMATELAPEDVLAILLDIERRAGRVRTTRNAARRLDLDLLMLGDLRRDTPALTLPHPRMWDRAFVLCPLVEIAPELVEPVTGESIVTRAARLAADGGCVRFGNLALP